LWLNLLSEILQQTKISGRQQALATKGGLDARWYIATTVADKVANLIMIGTPNAGSPAAFVDILVVLSVLIAICFQGRQLLR
jgi:triacylglycerol esterase/lipase EstA (alpha/beta hydrolase family)